MRSRPILGPKRSTAMATTAAENRWWATQAALLDPLAYEWILGTHWARTVPNGEAWWAVSMGGVDMGRGKRSAYIRVFDSRRALMIGSGTTFGTVGDAEAGATICRPALVVNVDQRYRYARDLYYERLDSLASLQTHELYGEVANGAPIHTTAEDPFPTDFEHGMIVGASVYDAAWVTLDGMNMMSEVNNDHSVRFADGLLCPFNRADRPKLRMMGGARSGLVTDTCSSGFASVYYVKLPPGF